MITEWRQAWKGRKKTHQGTDKRNRGIREQAADDSNEDGREGAERRRQPGISEVIRRDQGKEEAGCSGVAECGRGTKSSSSPLGRVQQQCD